MAEARIRELRNHLSRYLDRVQAGEGGHDPNREIDLEATEVDHGPSHVVGFGLLTLDPIGMLKPPE